MTTRPKRTPRASRASDRISHLHVVIDDTLRAKLEEHARKLGYDRPNLSAAVRDLLRKKLKLPGVEAA